MFLFFSTIFILCALSIWGAIEVDKRKKNRPRPKTQEEKMAEDFMLFRKITHKPPFK